MNPSGDRNVEALLRGLNAVQPPPHLEARILRRLRHPPRRGAGRGSVRVWLGPGSLAATALLALALVVTLRCTQRAAPASSAADRPATLRSAASGSAPAHAGDALVRSSVLRRPAFRASRPLPTGSVRQAAAAEAQTALPVSFPAPPLPLTDQERLVLRLARRPTSGTLAIFDPRLRQERAALEAAEFNQFFQPPPPAVRPSDTKEDKHEPTDDAAN